MIIFGDICCRLISSSLSAAGSSESLGTLVAGCWAMILELCAVDLNDLGQADDRQEILSAWARQLVGSSPCGKPVPRILNAISEEV